MTDTLFSPPRSAPKKQNFIPYSTPQLHNPFPSLPDCAENGEPNLFGVIKQLILPLQNQRKWKVSTCHSASRLMENNLYNKFSNISFSSILEEDLCSLLDQFEKASLPTSTKQRLKFLIKVIFQLAFELGLTSTTLWGIPEWSISEDDPFTDSKEYTETKNALLAAKQKRKLDQIFGTGRSVSSIVELVILIDMLCSAQSQGELIAGLIIWICGARPAEACNLKYKHFRKIAENVWSFTRADIGDSVDGKTSNASRHLILPYFLAHFIRHRISYLLSLGYTREEIDEMFVACPGQDYTAKDTVSTTELNRKLKAIYYRAGVAEDMMLHAYTALTNSKEVYEHCSGSSSAYLGRHQVTTELYGVGLPLNDCALSLGHAKIEGFHHKSDFARADVASEIYHKLSFRPVVFILDAAFSAAETGGQLFEHGGVDRIELEKHLASLELLSVNHFSFAELSSSVHSDLPANISFDEDTLFSIAIIPDTPNEILSFTSSNIESLSIDKYPFPIFRSVSEYVSVQKAAADVAISTLANYKKEHLKLPETSEDMTPDTAKPTDSTLQAPLSENYDLSLSSEQHYRIDSSSADTTVLAIISPDIPEPDENDTNVLSNTPVNIEILPASISEETNLSTSTSLPLAPAPPVYPPEDSNKSVLYLKTSRGLLPIPPDLVQIRALGRNGVKHPDVRSNTEVLGLLSHTPDLPMYVVSTDSTVFRIPPCKNLIEYVEDHKYFPACKALLERGIPLQSSLLSDYGCNLLFLAQDGNIRLLSSSALTKLEKASSIQLFSMPEDQRIVSACCLSDIEESVLLTATNGKALLIPTDMLHAVKAPGARLVHGMSLEANTPALACLTNNHVDLIAVSSDGKAHRVFLNTIPAKAPGRKSTQLTACIPLAAVKAAPENSSILLCTSTGYLHCIDPSSVPEKYGSEVQAITFRTGRTSFVVDALPVQAQV